MSSFYGNSGGSGGQSGGLTPEQLALIYNAQWKSEGIVELFNETLEGWIGESATLSYSDEITVDPLYVTFNGEEYVCPRNEFFNMVCYGGFGEHGPDFNQYPFYIIRTNGVNKVTPNYDSSQTFTISARSINIEYTNAFKEGVEKYGCTYVKDYIDPQTNSKTKGVVEGDVSFNVASGIYSHAEGLAATASGQNSHAEGRQTNASAIGSHAEGSSATASGQNSHAEGGNTTARGENSHAEGNSTTANGPASHAEGTGTNAKFMSQHVFGEYNVIDPSTGNSNTRGNYVEIVGNGNSVNNKSNARTLDWSGNESLAGGLTLGKGTADEVTITAAQLKQLLALLN